MTLEENRQHTNWHYRIQEAPFGFPTIARHTAVEVVNWQQIGEQLWLGLFFVAGGAWEIATAEGRHAADTQRCVSFGCVLLGAVFKKKSHQFVIYIIDEK